MKRISLLSLAAAGLLLAAMVVKAVPPAPAPHVLEFKTMFPVSGPYVGTTNPIRGVSGGGVPWIVTDARGGLRGDGSVDVRVRGLVLASSQTNPIPNFRAVVSCQSIDGTGAPSIVNVSTDDFPASSTGDAVIEDTVELPHPCVAPIVFVTNSTLRWFAVTGQ